MSTAASFTIAKRWRQTKCSSTDEGINELWNVLKPQKEMTIQLKQDKIQFIKMKNKFCLSRHIINKLARQVNLGKLSANPVW